MENVIHFKEEKFNDFEIKQEVVHFELIKEERCENDEAIDDDDKKCNDSPLRKENVDESDSIEFLRIKDELIDSQWTEHLEPESDPLALPELHVENKCHSVKEECNEKPRTSQGATASGSLDNFNECYNYFCSILKKSLISNNQSTEILEGTWPYTCIECKIKFAELKYLENHILTKHLGNIAYVCRKCNYSSNQLSNLKTHLKRHTKYKCKECDFTSSNNGLLKAHKSEHKETVAKKFVLDKNKHAKGKHHKCTHCLYTCSRPGHLKNHIRSKHTREKPFKCTECDFTSLYVSSFEVHTLAKHAVNNPHKCTECKYTAAHLLKKHVMTTHTG